MKSKDSVFRVLLDFIYPPLCLSCGRLMGSGADKLCGDCWGSIPRLSSEDHLYRETREKLLLDGAVDDLRALFLFEKGGAFQHIAHAVKYRSYESLARMLGRTLGESLKGEEREYDALVPVPLHRVKLRERGYNQAELIAQGVHEVTAIPVAASAVHRTRHTRTQTKLSHDERRKNMDGAFEPDAAGMLNGARVLLIDDVITTGATTTACAAAIRLAGASRVVAAAVALARKDSDGLV